MMKSLTIVRKDHNIRNGCQISKDRQNIGKISKIFSQLLEFS